jgi:hypothetical protein
VEQGGTLRVLGGRTDATTAFFLRAGYPAQNGRFELDGVAAGPGVTYWIHLEGDTAASLHQRNIVTPYANAANWLGAGNFDVALYTDRVVLLDTSSQISTLSGFKGDRARLRYPTAGAAYEWACTASSPAWGGSGSPPPATWKVIASAAS